MNSGLSKIIVLTLHRLGEPTGFVTVVVKVPVAPNSTLPKSSVSGLTVQIWVEPVPDSATLTGFSSGSLLAMSNVPLSGFASNGV